MRKWNNKINIQNSPAMSNNILQLWDNAFFAISLLKPKSKPL